MVLFHCEEIIHCRNSLFTIKLKEFVGKRWVPFSYCYRTRNEITNKDAITATNLDSIHSCPTFSCSYLLFTSSLFGTCLTLVQNRENISKPWHNKNVLYKHTCTSFYSGLVSGLCFARTKQMFLRHNTINMFLINTHKTIFHLYSIRWCYCFFLKLRNLDTPFLVSILLIRLSHVRLFISLCTKVCIYYILQTKCFILALYTVPKQCVHKMPHTFRHNLKFSPGFISC